ncbi:2-oxoglutarate dehydrogenase complex dihydrolipoyllysine-residue succinyltransferase [Pedosphaera parvula]|uniref:Dihydrolipoyllysine-residue succinyltransferase component of 2-oxoglutarate dehydrogenase complex n=1 Tax=Pedosphaera parvula (strain Ellin514) TaxID=320771 RepID=B9XMW9_PEDPL|nr:2-oxoglutarate dehydrogenase complex dihydrolipoyllysine-residue succinyltransferase [Pedosphaera parvula]EEF58765.1 2-oxoglutarate dehydrogenase, E2 subunit, dihydrolipoamide succinyltransferase [Pedosphaera parvula Ellin514]
MSIELKVPAVGESISEVEIGEWLKPEGATVGKDENVVTLESEKATVELPSPVTGKITKILKQKGETASVGEVIGYLDEVAAGPAKAPEAKPAPAKESTGNGHQKSAERETKPFVMPAAQREMAAQHLKPEEVKGTGPGGRVLKEDVQWAAGQPKPEPQKPSAPQPAPAGGREEEVVPMTPLRRAVAKHLVEAQQNAALLTTFNEVDMSAVMLLRKEYQETFQAKYGIKLGFMSFFVKASIDALKLVPQVNAEIRGNNIVYRNYFDVGVAIGGGKGLVVPIIRSAERLSFAEIELAIAEFGKRAKDNKLKPDELQGGTFTISNGGVYGSLLSTPIVNPPQSGILGLHAIQERPIALQGQVVIRPMMYIALTYDHRIVDGREAVTFLKRIKEIVEAPTRMLLEV